MINETESTSPTATEQIAVLLQLDDQSFSDLLVSQLRPLTRNEEAWAAFLDPAVIKRTKLTIDALRMRIQTTLERKKIELDELHVACREEGPEGRRRWYTERVPLNRSRSQTGHFLSLVEAAQKAVKLRSSEIAQEADSNRIRGNRRTNQRPLRKLVAQIIKHENEYDDDEVSEGDRELWDLLDNLDVSVGGSVMTLREAHESGWSD